MEVFTAMKKEENWSCSPKFYPAYPHIPVVVFREPFSGTGSVFGMFESLNQVAGYAGDVEFMNLYEAFRLPNEPDEADEKQLFANTVHQMHNAMTSHCALPLAVSETSKDAMLKANINFMAEGNFDSAIKSIGIGRQSSQLGHEDLVVHRVKGRYIDPIAFFRYLRSIPSQKTHSFFGLEISRLHLEGLATTPEQTARLNRNSKDESKVVIVWTRRTIEPVIRVLAGGNGSLVVKKEDLERGIMEMRRYYENMRGELFALGVPFEVFEYERDLAGNSNSKEQRMKTTNRLLGMLNIPTYVVSAEKVLESFETTNKNREGKVTPIEQQVENWDEVKEWGYGGKLDEWEDLFAPGI
jgi:hypothetical protein